MSLRSMLSLSVKPVFLTMTVIYPLFLLILTEAMAGGSAVFPFTLLARSPLPLLPPLLLMSFLFYILLFALGKPWLAALTVSPIFLFLAGVNYFRMSYTNIPLTASDFFLAANAEELMLFTDGLHFAVNVFSAVVVFLIYIIILFISERFLYKREMAFRREQNHRRPKRAWSRKFVFFWRREKRYAGYRNAALLTLAFISIVFSPAAPAIIRACITDSRTLTASYEANGFAANFLSQLSASGNSDAPLSIKSASPPPASGIIPPAISALKDNPETNRQLEQEPEAELMQASEPEPETILPDIIIILSEAYWDPRNLPNVEFSKNPASNFDRLGETSITGTLVSSVFGGRTDHPEFEVLTGMSMDAVPFTAPFDAVASEKPSIASYLKEFGYDTVGLHTFHRNFYNRDRAYLRLGFDVFKGMQDIPYQYTMNGRYVPDWVIFQWISDTLDAAENPTFIMAITMENHGPYDTRFARGEVTTGAIEGVRLSQDVINTLRSYANTFDQADKMLGDLTDFLSERDRPAVVLFFGDHLPFLGRGHIGYVEGGFLETGNENRWTDDDFLKMHSTPFLIWSTESTERRDAGYLNPYFLGAMTLEAAGLPINTFYMNMIYYQAVLPVSRSFITIDRNGRAIAELTETQNEWQQWHRYQSREFLN